MKLLDRIKRELARFLRRTSQKPATDEPVATVPQTEPEAQTQAAPEPDTPQERVEWRFGGFDGSRAVEDSRVQVGSVKMRRDRMTFKWTKGDLSAWGIAREDAGAIAAAFFWDGEKWVGGKFDWISTSRTSRDWKNISTGYHGWNAAQFFAAKRRAFCVVSRDGKRRTNIAEDWA